MDTIHGSQFDVRWYGLLSAKKYTPKTIAILTNIDGIRINSSLRGKSVFENIDNHCSFLRLPWCKRLISGFYFHCVLIRGSAKGIEYMYTIYDKIELKSNTISRIIFSSFIGTQLSIIQIS